MRPLLVTVATARLRLSVRAGQARWAHPEGGRPGVAARVLEGEGAVRVDVANEATAFAEETAYTLTAEALDGSAVTVEHDDPVVAGAFEALAPGLAHGVVNFGGMVGKSRFVVRLDGAEHLAVTLDVCPSKLDYRDDFRHLLDDLGRMADDLALAWVSAAYVDARLDDAPGGGPLGRATVLDTFAGTLERSLAFAFRQPLRQAAPLPAPVATHRLRRLQPTAAARLVRPTASDTPARIVQPALVFTFDTPEHRYLAAHLRAAAHDTRLLARGYSNSPRGRAGRDRLDALALRLERLAASGPLADLPPDLVPPAAAPLRLAQAPGYREAAHVLRLVRQRLSLGEGGRVRARLKALHRLYEAWAWLALVDTLGALTGRRVPAPRLVRPDATGTRLRLRLGPARLVFPAPGGGRLVLHHAPRFSGPPMLVPQQPDVVLVHERAGAPDRWLVLDAKYRLDRSEAYVARFGVPGPPTAVLADLHRYRDALVRPGGIRSVTHAVALYPERLDADAWGASGLAGSLAEAGVGAVPALPGSLGALRRFLSGWMTHDAG